MVFLKVTLGKNGSCSLFLCSMLEKDYNYVKAQFDFFTKQTKDFIEHIKRQKKLEFDKQLQVS